MLQPNDSTDWSIILHVKRIKDYMTSKNSLRLILYITGYMIISVSLLPFLPQNNDISDVDILEDHLKRTNPAYRRRPQPLFRRVLEKALLTVQQTPGTPKPELHLQVHCPLTALRAGSEVRSSSSGATLSSK